MKDTNGGEENEEEEREVSFEATTRNNFIVFKNSLPKNLLTIPLQSQEVLLDLVDLYIQEKNKILPYEIFHEREARVSRHSSLVTDVNVAIIFIGFPSNSISRMKELWFEKLRRSDHLQGLLSSALEEVLETPSRVQIQHQFHALETSFHLESAIASFLDAIALKKSSTSPHFYLNAWEVDDLLTSLKDTLFDSSTSEDGETKPDLTFCILNLDLLQGRNTSAILPHYAYRNGFAHEDMARMKESDAIRHAAGQVVRILPHKSRMIVDGLESKHSLSGSEIPTGARTKKEFQTDKVRTSKKWATVLKEKLEKVKEETFEQRILSILTNEKRSPVFESYRHVLAREIFSNEMQTSFDQSANSQSFQRRHGVDSCETDLWTGSNGVVWLDVRATEGAPYSSHSHQPLDYHDLLRKSSATSHTGTEYRPEDSQHEYISLLHSIQQHQTHCIELLSHLTPTCPSIRTLYDLSPVATPDIRLLHFQQIVNQIHALINQGSPEEVAMEYCGLLLIQRTLLDAVYEISTNLQALLQSEMALDHNQDDQVYYNDAMNFHNRILAEVLEASNMFVGKGHFSQSGFSSSLLNNAMARLSTLTLGLSRQLISRPILFHEKPSSYSPSGGGGGKMSEAKRRISAVLSSSSTSSSSSITGRSALAHLTILHEMTSYYDELVNSSKLLPSSSSHSLGASFYGEDQSDLRIDEEMSRWGSLFPPLYLPQYVEVDIFLVKMQQTYEPIDDDSGFNMPIFMKEIEKLTLPNQQLTVSTHHIDGANEAILSLSLEGCRRTRGLSQGGGELEEVTYLSAECVWGRLQHQDQEEAAALEEERDKASNLKQPHTQSLSLFRNKHHVAIFLLSVDEEKPLFLKAEAAAGTAGGAGALETAVTIGDTILLVQNQQTSVRQEIKCGEHFVFQNLRNPLGIALQAVGSALLGMHVPVAYDPLSSGDQRKAAGVRTNQIVATCGGSPHFGSLSGATPLFNQFDLDSAHRGRMLRSLEYAVWMASRNQEDLLFLRDHSLRMEGVSVESLVALVREAVQERDWAKAGSFLNFLLRNVFEQREKIEHGKAKRILELELKGEGQKRKKGVSSPPGPPSPLAVVMRTLLYDLLRAATLSAAISFLLFVLFNVILSRWKGMSVTRR